MSCTDVQTIQAGNGTKTQFSFDFPYIFKSEIHVYFWNATTKEYDEKLTTDSTYPWRITDANPTIVEFTGTAPPAPATPVDPNETAVDNVKIRRVTNIDDIRALFNPGSAIRSDDLNNNFEQLKYAIQESNCPGVSDDVDQYLKDYYWDRFDNTLYTGDTWISDDTKIASTGKLDERFWDQDTDTIDSTEAWQDSDDYIPTAAAVDSAIDEAITNDIATDGTGITVTDDGDGTITLGIAQNTVDLDRIKNGDIINQAEQDASSPNPADTNIFTALAAARRFDTFVQTGTPAGSNWETGKIWYQNDEDKTVYIWNGSSWEAITSGGAFTRLDQVIYVDSINGNDANNGHRISTPKRTIKSALAAINADSTYGDGSTILIAPGVYQETAPLDIQKKDVSIIGASVRNVIVHPTAATETESLFRVNSGSYLHNMTFTGVKASGTRGDTGSLWENDTYGLPPTQGWNVSFYPGAMIYKSPYIQNCTNFSDSEIDNNDLQFYLGSEDKGRAGDVDHAPTGGGLLVDGSTVHNDSPLRSIVADSYTHVGLDGPGIFVTNNGYTQITSSYAFFNHFHIACINGGQANLAASTSDFGRFSLVASGKSTTDIFDGLVKGNPTTGDTTFVVDGLTANAGWHGSAVRPASNMLVEVGGELYPILSATKISDTEFTVEITRPDPNDRTSNLGLSTSPADNSAVKFYLRSQIASSGHTMEYVGAGLDYRALPENATGTYAYGTITKENGVPIEAHQKIELDNGKIWAAITDHNGKFRVGETFSVDQTTGFVNIPAGALSVSTLLADLDLNGYEIVTTSGGDIVLNPDSSGTVNVSNSKIENVLTPVAGTDAANKDYVDNFTGGTSNIADGAVTNAKLAAGAVDTTKMSDATVVTNSEHSTATTNDTSFFTTSASDARYFRQDSTETIESGDTWSSDDARIATTAAIDARVIDLVDDVGGFVPIASETAFPTSNPDVNDGAGTLISIKEIGNSRAPSSGIVTIANGSGTDTVTIIGCGSTVLAAGFGAIVETTPTLHTYTFHRLTPKATEVTTVAGISTDVTTVSGISSDVTTVSGVSSDVTTVAGISSDVTTVAGKATEIGLLGTTDAVADMAILGTTDVVADLNTLGTADVVSDMNTLATTANVTAMSNCSDDISNINTVAGSISNVNTVAGDITNVNTVASNISSVNDFAARYRISATAPTTSLDDGDLWWDTTSDVLKVYDASSSAWVVGVTDTTGFVTTAGATMTGQLNTITPTSGSNATNKTYVDGTIDFKIDNALTGDIVGGTGITVSDNTPLSGQITVSVTSGSIGATQLASTAVTAGTYGSSTQIPGFTVDADGRLTSANVNTIAIASTSVDGFMSSSDKTKLDGIETGATADQTGAEIKAAYEAENDTNAFTDAEKTKLSGIAAGAEVNVNADWNASSGDAQILNKPTIPTNNNQLTNGAGYLDENTGNYNGTYPIPVITGGHAYTAPTAGAVAITGSTGQITTPSHGNSSQWNTAYGWGNHASAGYITSADGGNAGTLDGIDSSQFLRSDASDNYTGSQLQFTGTGVSTMHHGSQGWQVSGSDAAYQRVDARDDGTNYARMHWYGVSDAGSTSNFRHAWYDGANYINITASGNAINFQRGGVGQLQVDNNTVWHAGNDGSGSGLDADTLDGLNSTQFLRSDVADNYTTLVQNGSSNGASFTSSGSWGTRHNTSHGYIDFGPANTSYAHIYTDRASFYFNAPLVRSGNTVWDAGNDGAGSGLDADNLDGYTWDSAKGSVRASEFYADNWFRNYNSGEGLYNEANTMYWYSTSNTSWRNRSNQSTVNIAFATSGDTTRGYVYANNSSEIGFLNDVGSWSLRCDNSGNVTATGNVTAYSDIRLKSDIEPITNALDKVSQINGVTFTRVDSGERQVGVIAQDVEKVLPEAVRDGEEYKSVAYGNMVGLLIEAVKEQQATIQQLTERIEILEGGK